METILKIENYETNDVGWLMGGKPGQSGYKITTDKQEITLSIGNEQDCCEHWGYFWCNDSPQEFVGAKLLDIKLTDRSLNQAIFKKEFGRDDIYEGGIMFVDIVTDIGVLQFVAYNEHNGYYGHEAVISSTQLNKSEYL